MAAKGSCTSNIHRNGALLSLKWAWTSDTNGDVDENGSGGAGFFCKRIFGWVVGFKVKWVDAAANYDVYIKDELGMDILKGLGANLAADAADAKNRAAPINISQQLAATGYAGSLICLWNSTLEIVVDDAGDTKTGEFELYVLLPEKWENYGLRE